MRLIFLKLLSKQSIKYRVNKIRNKMVLYVINNYYCMSNLFSPRLELSSRGPLDHKERTNFSHKIEEDMTAKGRLNKSLVKS